MYGKFFIILLAIALFMTSTGFGNNSPRLENSEIRLIHEDYDAWSGDISPDGQRVVFSGKPKGEDSMKMRVWLMNLSGGTPVMWTNTEGLMDGSPRWSPTGDGVVMVRCSKLNTEENGMGIASSIWWKAFPSGQGHQLTTGTDDREPAWSPDGQSVVFVRGDGLFGESLMIMDRLGQQQKVLLSIDNGKVSDPFWGSDGWIYYTRYLYQKRTIDVAGKQYEDRGTAKGSIERIHPENVKVETVLQNMEDNRSPSLSPNGRYLAFVSTQGNRAVSGRIYDRGALWIMDMKDKSLRLISDRAGLNCAPPVWTPKGDAIVFFSYRQVRPALWSVNVQ